MIAEVGSKIKLDYEGTFDSGEVFDTSKHGDHSHPLEFTIGKQMVIPGFEKEVIGMKEGEEKEFSIEPKEAYGEYNEALIQEIPRENLPKDQNFNEGEIAFMQTPEGQKFALKVVKSDEEKVIFDMNHPLAGKRLNFKIKIIELDNSQ